MGGGYKLNIPDYKSFTVEDCPQMMELQKALEKKGLKDPWIRNHVWKYRHPMTNNSKMSALRMCMLPGANRGMTLGVAATFVYIVCDQVYRAFAGKPDSHGHH